MKRFNVVALVVIGIITITGTALGCSVWLSANGLEIAAGKCSDLAFGGMGGLLAMLAKVHLDESKTETTKVKQNGSGGHNQG